MTVTPKLEPYQEEGARWLAERRRGVLADKPGMGKTAQAITACDLLGCRRILVIAPKTILHNWKREIELWSHGDVQILTTKNDITQARWHVTNYEVPTRRNLLGGRWDALIVDEAHRIKNRKAARTRAVFALSRRVPHVFPLTGTPILNRPDELWALLHAVAPKVFRSYWKWVDEHCLQETVYAGPGRPVVTKVVGVIDPERFRRVIADYVLMRDYDLLPLPDRLNEIIRVEMRPRQWRQYEQMRRTYIADMGNQLLVAQNALTRLIRLQQLALDPRLVDGTVRGAKTDAILEFAEDHAPDQKLLIFTTFRSYANLLRQELMDKGIETVTITGQQSARERQVAAERFQQDDGVRVLVGTYEAMSEGLNLQAADVVIHANKPWVPALVEQAEARAVRRGRRDPVTVISVIAENTVDAHIEEVLAEKLATISVVSLYQKALDDSSIS